MENEFLTTEQLLLLENLTYLVDTPPLSTLVTSQNNSRNKLTVKEIVGSIRTENLDPTEDYGSYITGSDWKNILEAIKADETLCNMRIVETKEAVRKEDKTSQPQEKGKSCSSVLFVNDETGEAVVAFRGTGEVEWKDNFLGAALTGAEDAVSTKNQKEALAWYQNLNLEQGGYSMITLVGHSKGGNKAVYITLMDESVGRCLSIDGQGYSDEFLDKYQKEIEKTQWKITNHGINYDFVNPLLNTIGEKKFYIGFDYGEGGILEAHSPNTFFSFVEENGVMKATMVETDGPAIEIEILNQFFNNYIRSLSPEDKVKAMDVIGELVESAFTQTLDEDFDEIMQKPDSYKTLALLVAYAYIYSEMHPSFPWAVKSIVNRFYDGEMASYIINYISRLFNKISMKDITFAGIGLLHENNGADRQIASTYQPLEKNRVFDVAKLEELGLKGKELMDTGVKACETWNKIIDKVRDLYNSVPGEI